MPRARRVSRERGEMSDSSGKRTPCLGVIGGSGLYAIPGVETVKEHRVTTPYGEPSDALIEARIGETRVLFLPRHGRGHRIQPHEVNYRANVFALKSLGAEQIVSVSAVGSMKEEIAPGTIVTADQYIDRTRSRASTFFEGRGIVGHVSVARPVDAALRAVVTKAVGDAGGTVHDGGTYVCIEGPQFSTRAESESYRREGVSVIGMTQMPEAKLAREAELPYAAMCLVTDYDCWHPSEAAVEVEHVLEVMRKNVALAAEAIRRVAGALPDPTESPASRALAGAVMTAPDLIPKETRVALAPLIGKYFPA